MVCGRVRVRAKERERKRNVNFPRALSGGVGGEVKKSAQPSGRPSPVWLAAA